MQKQCKRIYILGPIHQIKKQNKFNIHARKSVEHTKNKNKIHKEIAYEMTISYQIWA